MRQAHFDRLVDEAVDEVLRVYQRSLADDFIDSIIQQAQWGIPSDIPFDRARKGAMKLRALGAVRAHAVKMAEAAKASWQPESKLADFKLKPHLNRAAFYAVDQTGFLFGQAQKELAFTSGASRYRWLRTSSKNPRDEHLSRVGKIYRFGELPDEPGVLFNCKCSLEPIYD